MTLNYREYIILIVTSLPLLLTFTLLLRLSLFRLILRPRLILITSTTLLVLFRKLRRLQTTKLERPSPLDSTTDY